MFKYKCFSTQLTHVSGALAVRTFMPEPCFLRKNLKLIKRTILLRKLFNFKYPYANAAVGSLVYRYYSSADDRTNQRSSGGLGIAESTLRQQGVLESQAKSGAGKTKEDDEEKRNTERDRTIRALKYTFLCFSIIISGFGGFMIYTWGAPPKDAFGNPIKDEFSDLPLYQQYIKRSFKEVKNFNKMIQEPSREKLLPEPLKEPYIQPKYTLVLELGHILVHPEWTHETGWRFKKRPGVEFLLQHCSPPLFEIVIYTNFTGFTAFPVIEKLDPNGFIWYKLFRDSTRYDNGKHMKDLHCLNRDLSKVIIVDWDKEAVTSPRNQLQLPKWDGDLKDQSLIDMGIMLRTIAESDVDDVREVLDYYRTFENPLVAFKENKRLAEEQELVCKQKAEERQQKVIASGWTSSFLRK